MVSYQRARTDERKEERRRLLLDAAQRLCERSSFAEVTMAAVAAEAGLAKGTVYLYFETKEELFLALLEEELWSWFDELDLHLDRLKTGDARKVARLALDTIAPRQLLLRLLAILHALLEQNLAESSARRFKQATLEHVAATGTRLEALLGLRAGDGAQALLTMHALVVGLMQMASPAKVVAKVLEEPHLAPLRVDFAPALDRAITALLVGLVHEANQRRK